MTANRDYARLASGGSVRVDLACTVHARHRKRTDFAGAFPARHVFLVELHELDRRGHRLFLVAELEDGVAADHLLGLDERPVDNAELAVADAYLRAHGDRHQSAGIDHAAR